MVVSQTFKLKLKSAKFLLPIISRNELSITLSTLWCHCHTSVHDTHETHESSVRVTGTLRYTTHMRHTSHQCVSLAHFGTRHTWDTRVISACHCHTSVHGIQENTSYQCLSLSHFGTRHTSDTRVINGCLCHTSVQDIHENTSYQCLCLSHFGTRHSSDTRVINGCLCHTSIEDCIVQNWPVRGRASLWTLRWLFPTVPSAGWPEPEHWADCSLLFRQRAGQFLNTEPTVPYYAVSGRASSSILSWLFPYFPSAGGPVPQHWADWEAVQHSARDRAGPSGHEHPAGKGPRTSRWGETMCCQGVRGESRDRLVRGPLRMEWQGDHPLSGR